MLKSYLCLLPMLLCLLPGCQLQPPKRDSNEPVKKTAFTLLTDPNAIAGVPSQVNDRNPLMPLHLAGILDKTGSTEANKIPNFTEEQLKTIAKGLQERGGEFRLLATTVATKPPEMKSKPEIVVVSPGAGAGMLEQLQPTKFESIDAAIEDILSRIERGDRRLVAQLTTELSDLKSQLH